MKILTIISTKIARIDRKIKKWFARPVNRMCLVRTLVSTYFWFLGFNLIFRLFIIVLEYLPLWGKSLKNYPAICELAALVFIVAVPYVLIFSFFPVMIIYFRAVGMDVKFRSTPRKRREVLVSYLRSNLLDYALREFILQAKTYLLFWMWLLGCAAYYLLIGPVISFSNFIVGSFLLLTVKPAARAAIFYYRDEQPDPFCRKLIDFSSRIEENLSKWFGLYKKIGKLGRNEVKIRSVRITGCEGII